MSERILPASSRSRAPRQGLVLLTLCMAVLIVQVNTSVVNLAVRPLAEYFHARVSTMQWLVDGFNLTYASLLLSGGLLADLFGRRRTFLCGALAFTAASLLCLLAPTLSLLVAGQVLAGLSAALLLPSSLAMIRVVWRDASTRGQALGVWAGCNGLALAIGPVAGGLLIQACGWRSIFALTLPLGVLTAVLAAWALPESADRSGRHIDVAAQCLGVLALGGFTLAAIEGHKTPWIMVLALVVALPALIGFVIVERHRGDAALVPLGLLRVHSFRGSVYATMGMTFGIYAVLFLLPMTWLAAHRLDAFGAGLALIPMALLFVVLSPFSGAFSARFGMRVAVVLGMSLMAAGLVLIGLCASGNTLVFTEIGLALAGIGMGLATGPLMGGAVNAVGSARSGTAASLINVARMVGATLGVAILGTLYILAGHGYRGLAVALCAGAAMQVVATLAAARCLQVQETFRPLEP